MEEKKESRFYSRGGKAVVLSLQIFCVLLVGICGYMSAYFVSIVGGFSEATSSHEFEETSRFSELVAKEMTSVSGYIDQLSQFETDGVFDEKKTIDIMNPEERDPKKQNKYTTYTVKDLKYLWDSGALSDIAEGTINATYVYPDEDSRLRGSFGETIKSKVGEDQDVNEYSGTFVYLYEKIQSFERRLPLSEQRLADYALDNAERLSLMELYQSLHRAGERLWEYEQAVVSSRDSGNIKYYIQNKDNKQVYSNGKWKTLENAWTASSDGDFALRYERTPGQVTFVKSNNRGSQWLQKKLKTLVFYGNREEVVITVDTTYPEVDELRQYSQHYSRFQPIFMPMVVLTVLSFLCGMACFVLATIQSGRREKKGPIYLNGFDRIPVEVGVAIVCIAAVITLGFSVTVSDGVIGDFSITGTLYTVFIMVLGSTLFMWGYLSLVRRIKARTIWKNSLCRAIVTMCKRVYGARTTSRKLLIFFIIFFLAHIFLIAALSGIGIFLAFIGDMLILLYLIKDAAGMKTIKVGLDNIAAGDLEYKIDVSNLQGDNLEMAEAVNHVAEGLQHAVGKSMKDERMRSELITNVSHDIKTPLTSIINYVDLLKREQIENAKIKGYIEILDAKSQRLKQLTEDLVEASKVSSGNIELQMSRIVMQQMLHQAYGEFDEKFRKRGLETMLSMVEEPLVIWADGRQLWRIFENLLNNIAKYALGGTRVYIDLRIINKKAVLMLKNISEQPLNISADELSERFVRGDSSRTTEGSGLGLSIAMSLTELQKGSFDIYLDGDLFKITITFDLIEEQNE